jgi:hypothetical protein
MIGDGLNDAGALRQSQTIMTMLTRSLPSDAILEAKQFHQSDFLRFGQISKNRAEFWLIVGLQRNLYFVGGNGNLSPFSRRYLCR